MNEFLKCQLTLLMRAYGTFKVLDVMHQVCFEQTEMCLADGDNGKADRWNRDLRALEIAIHQLHQYHAKEKKDEQKDQ